MPRLAHATTTPDTPTLLSGRRPLEMLPPPPRHHGIDLLFFFEFTSYEIRHFSFDSFQT